jgi:hypothetical protein
MWVVHWYHHLLWKWLQMMLLLVHE